MKISKQKSIVALICAVVLLVNLSHPAFASSNPAVTVNSVTAAPGETVTVSVSGSNFECVSALDLMVTYDTNAFTLVSASGYSKMQFESINSKTPGFVQYSGISDEGLSGNNSIFYMTFSVSPSAAEQAYSLAVMVTEAKAVVNEADVDIDISTTAGQITVVKKTTTPTLYFYNSLSAQNVEEGGDVRLNITCYTPNGLAAGQFAFTYDSDLFTYKSLELGSSMTEKEYVSSLNNANPGQIVLAYTAEEAVSSGTLMTLTLTAKEGKSGVGSIQFVPLALADADGNPLLFDGALSANVTVSQKPEVPVYPKVWLSTDEDLSTDKSFAVDVYVEGSSHLAAADFTISYDADALICENISTNQTDDGSNVTVVINDNYKNGTAKFSMLYSPGISEDTKLVTIRFHAKNNVLTKTSIRPSVSTPVDKNVHAVVLDCENLDIKINNVASGNLGSIATGTALSWNNTNNAVYVLYPSTMADEDINAEWLSEEYSGIVCTNKESSTTATVDGKVMYSQAFTFTGLSEGSYKLAIFKAGKYIPKIVSVTVNGFFSSFEQQRLWLYGDVNSDGRINATDATNILAYYTHKPNNAISAGNAATLAERLLCADVNLDGKINATDATQILSYYTHKPNNVFNKLK